MIKVAEKKIGKNKFVDFEKTIPRLKENQIGRFFVSNVFLYHYPKELKMIFDNATIIRANSIWGPNNQGVEYTALHDMFKPSDEGCIIPCYQFIIDTNKNEVRCEEIDMVWNW